MSKRRNRHHYAQRQAVANRRSRAGAPRGEEQNVTVMTGNQLLSFPSALATLKDKRFELWNPDDLLGRKGYSIYREMRTDDTVKACLKFKKVLISGREWEIEPAGGKEANQQQKDQAQFVEDCLHDLNMNGIMREQLTALDFGSSYGEIIWKVDDWRGQGMRIFPIDVKFRDPEWMFILSDVYGDITNFIQRNGLIPASLPSQTGAGDIVIDPGKILHYGYGSEFSNHYGTSDLRAAYAAWWSKKFVTQFYNVFLERFGQPLMMMKYPTGATNQLKQALQSILTNLTTKSDILVPEGVAVELVEATRAGTARYEEALNYYDVRISRAILVPALLGMGVDIKRGSDSQSRLHLRVLMKVANEVSMDLEKLYSEKLVKPLVDMNFEGVTEFPRFKFRDYGEYEAIEIVDSAINMWQAGMLDCDQNDINFLRSVLGFDLRQEGDDDELLRPQPPPIASPNSPTPNEQGAGAGQNNGRANKGPATRKNKPS